MADYETLFPGRFVRASDIGASEKTVTIKTVRPEKIDGKMKVVITFVGASKEFVCNRTNAEHIKIMLGRETETWIGKQITLHSVIIPDPFSDVKGATTPCVRVKGSPHIDRPMAAEVKRGRKTIFVSVVPTGKRPAPANGPPPPMTDEENAEIERREREQGLKPGAGG